MPQSPRVCGIRRFRPGCGEGRARRPPSAASDRLRATTDAARPLTRRPSLLLPRRAREVSAGRIGVGREGRWGRPSRALTRSRVPGWGARGSGCTHAERRRVHERVMPAATSTRLTSSAGSAPSSPRVPGVPGVPAAPGGAAREPWDDGVARAGADHGVSVARSVLAPVGTAGVDPVPPASGGGAGAADDGRCRRSPRRRCRRRCTGALIAAMIWVPLRIPVVSGGGCDPVLPPPVVRCRGCRR